MKHSDFNIGTEFICNGKTWRCTDVGIRTVLAIDINDKKDISWMNGPPYAVAEYVFDENDFPACYLDVNLGCIEYDINNDFLDKCTFEALYEASLLPAELPSIYFRESTGFYLNTSLNNVNFRYISNRLSLMIEDGTNKIVGVEFSLNDEEIRKLRENYEDLYIGEDHA